MGFRNGRASYEELKQKYDKVLLRHNHNEDGTVRTTCLLVKDLAVFVGVSKFSNRTFNFSKKKGRAIAQGRAELAASLFNGEITEPRKMKAKRREELSYIIVASENNTVEDIIGNFLHDDE